MNKRIYLSSPTMSGKEIDYINKAFQENWIAPLGPNVDGFEREVCDYLNTNYAVAMTTGTAAIQMALRYLGVGSGDVVFCSSLTFAASCNPIIYQNAIPVFIDSEPDSWNMSPAALKQAFSKYPNPKAVIVVDLYGQSADMKQIHTICEKHNVPIIEDAAEALGATYVSDNGNEQKCGTLGLFGILSFNGNKIITTSGGGILICPDEQSRAKILKWITQSRDQAPHYEHSELGYNYRMSNILAGIGRGQLTVIEERIKQKKDIFNIYKNELSGISAIEMMPITPYGNPNYWLSCITIEENSKTTPIDIIEALENENIESRPIWKPMHMQPFYKEYDYFPHSDDTDISADVFKRGVCLPSDVKMTCVDIAMVVDIIKGCF